MTPESMIYDIYGVRIRSAPRDGVMRSFKINDLHNGFLIAMHEGAVFGSIIHGDRWIIIPGYFKHYEAKHNESNKIRAEWLIWEIARSLLERGERLNAVDSERLALAVQRLEAWL
jgi:hypothetical protein